MEFRRADARFLLARPVRQAVVLGLPEWGEALEEVGIEVVAEATEPELVVAPGAAAAEALALRPAQLLLDGGRPARAVRAGGWSPLAVLPLPDAAQPELFLPAGQAAPVSYALRTRRPGGSWGARARTLVGRELLARGHIPPGRGALTVAARTSGPPFLLRAAAEALDLRAHGWFAAFDPWAQRFTRGAFLLFREDETVPAWVLKFARVPGLDSLFDADERGLGLAARAPVVAPHAPVLVGRFETDGLQASVESAAVGERLPAVLGSSRPRADRLAAIELVAEWLVSVGAETVAPAEALEPERRRWAELGLPGEILKQLPPVPAVFQHGDLVGENVIVGEDGFTAIDWESAREYGAPLWDLFYFLTGSLAAVDGLHDEELREEHFTRLWRGELPSSEVLFRRTREAVEAGKVPPEAVGPLATLLWLSYAALDLDEAGRLVRAEGHRREREPATARFARRWLSDPALGPGWSAWRS